MTDPDATPTDSRRAVLVFGEDTRSFLTVVRSLGRQGLRVHAAPFSMRSPAMRSRYIFKVHRLPYYLGNGADWLQAVQRLVAEEDIGFVVACEERSLLPLRRHRDALAGCIVALPNDAAFDAFFDKLATHRLADHCEVPAPRAVPAHRSSRVEELEAQLGYPMACKWRRSYDWPEIYARTKVAIVHDRTALRAWLAMAPIADDQVFVESFCPGFGLGVSVLCDGGHILQAFEHHRLNEIEGASYHRVSRPIDPARLAAVQRLATGTAFTGIAMFEFKHDPSTGQWWLLEVNARPWGSLPLPVAAGVDFPYAWYRLLVDHMALPATEYAHGVRARNVLADLQQARMRVQAAPGAWRKFAVAGAWLAGLPRALGSGEHWDTWTRDDPGPACAELAQLVALLHAKLYRKMPLRAPRRLCPQISQRELRVMFLCLGNICRSPYAEHRALALAQASGATVRISSAGTLPRNRRPSPPEALAAAARRGVDLSSHRSTPIDETLTAQADVIVYFDGPVREAFLDRYPEQAAKLVCIDALGPEVGRPAREVPDPLGEPEAVFDAAYARIDRMLEVWPLLRTPITSPT